MAIITGYLRDFTNGYLADYKPVMVFQSTTPGVDGNNVLVDKPIEVTTSSIGRFDVDLKPSGPIRPAMYYTVSVKWLDSDGGFIGFNEIPGKLYVPDGGGMFGEFFTTETGAPGLTWVSLSPPPSPGVFTTWLRMDPNDFNPDDDDPTVGDYYEWS
ncbi:MAG: hypothetical protein ABWY57_16050 [Mycetocola sp.]